MKKFYTLAVVLLATTTTLLAQTRTWVGPATGGSWTQANNWAGGNIPANGNSVLINDGVSGTITNVPTIYLASLRIEGNSTVTFNVTNNRLIYIYGNGSNTPRLNIESGSALILQGSNSNYIELELERTGGGGNSIRAQIDGTLVLGTNTWFTIDNGSTVATVTGAIENVSGTISSTTSSLQFAAGSFYRHQRNGSNLPWATYNASSTVEVTGVTSSGPGRLDQILGNFIWDNPNQSGIINLDRDLYDVRGAFTVASTGNNVLRLRSSNGGGSTTTVGGDFNLSGGTLVISNQGTHTLAVNGNVNLTGGTLSRTGSGTANFVFDRNGAQSFTRTSTNISGTIAFRIDNNSEVDFGTSVLNGTQASFQLDADGKIIVSHDDGLSSGTTASGAIQVGGGRSYSNNAIYEFRGARTGTFSTTGNDVQSLVFNNNTGEVLVQRAFDVTNNLELLNGYATNNAGTLITVGTGGTMSSSNGGYVNGVIAKNQSSNAILAFPVGSPDAGGFRPVTLSNMTGNNTNTFTARFNRTNPTQITNGTVLGPGLARVSACEYWTIDRSGGGSRTANVTIGWGTESNCATPVDYVTNMLTLRVARHDGARWVNEGGNLISGSSLASGEVRTTNRMGSYGAFALASSSITDNPLPVLFADVRAYAKNAGVQIEWSNLTERDVINYEVERSTNGVDFSSINLQLPKSNRDDKASYDHFDATTHSTNFYRIRVQEADGKAIYSKILRVELNSNKAAGFSLYPNPVTGKQFTVSLSGLDQGRYTLQVFNTAGKQVYSSTINNAGAGVTQMVELPASVQTGVYVTVVTGDNYRASKQVVIK